MFLPQTRLCQIVEFVIQYFSKDHCQSFYCVSILSLCQCVCGVIQYIPQLIELFYSSIEL